MATVAEICDISNTPVYDNSTTKVAAVPVVEYEAQLEKVQHQPEVYQQQAYQQQEYQEEAYQQEVYQQDAVANGESSPRKAGRGRTRR